MDSNEKGWIRGLTSIFRWLQKMRLSTFSGENLIKKEVKNESYQFFGFGSRASGPADPDGPAYPDPGRPKLSIKKEKKGKNSCLKSSSGSLNVFCSGSRRFIDGF
jgi:hypothetical protein